MNASNPEATAPGQADSPAAEASRLGLIALAGVKLVGAEDDIAQIVIEALATSGEALIDGDIVVIAQKIVSKAEGRAIDLAEVVPSARAKELAAATEKDPRVVELILSESTEVVRHRPGVLVVAHRLGFVLANAGIDRSNVAPEDEREQVLLLPEDPDGSAAEIRRRLSEKTGARIAVIINDSLGRAWRNGTVGIALGASGLQTLLDLRGRRDLFDRTLAATDVGHADEIAAAASLLMGQADEGKPVVIVRGLGGNAESGTGKDLLRAKETDLFR